MKKHDFHIPFLKELVIVSLITIATMFAVEYFICFLDKPSPHTPIHTSNENKNVPN